MQFLPKGITLGAMLALGLVGLISARAQVSSTGAPEAPNTCWEVSTTTEFGVIPSRFHIVRAGEQVSGSWLTYTSTLPLTGTIKGDVVTLSVTEPAMGQERKSTFVGTMRGDSISGKAVGVLGDGTFVATNKCVGLWKQSSMKWSTPPQTLDFSDRKGFVSIFDGTLNGWDGNRKFWRAEDGMIIGESTPANPSGNAYLTYRNMSAHDFDLKLEIKLERGGSGIQYRSHTGRSWRFPTPPDVVKNVGAYDSNLMLTGPQADFFSPMNPTVFGFNGQVFSENTPMAIEAYTGQVVRQYGEDAARRKLIATIAPKRMLTGYVNVNGWNEYEIVARGGVFIHIMNGQLMAVLVDDDPKSSNQDSGFFGLEIEGNTKVLVRNIYVRKLN